MGESSRTFCSRIKGNNVAFTKDKEKPTGSVQKDANAVSGTMVTSVQNLRHCQLLLQNLRFCEIHKSYWSKSIWENFSSAVQASL